MIMSDRDEFGAFLIGFMVGGLSGAIVALLMAPQSGEDTRSFIKSKAIVLKDQAASTAEDAYHQAEAAAEEARLRFEELSKDTREKVADLSRRGSVLLEEQKARIGAGKGTKPAASQPAEPA
jgi:gas vesicle protein